MHLPRRRWALLRNDGSGYKCRYMSREMVRPGTEHHTQPTPLQLHASTPVLTCGRPRVWEHEVLEDDVIIAGSDGLFDNLVIFPKPAPGAEKFRRQVPSDVDNVLKERLEYHARKCKVDCAVCKKMAKGGGGGRASAMCIGESIQKEVALNMARGGKPDDLTIFVTRVSMGSLPDLPRETCTAMKVSVCVETPTTVALSGQELYPYVT